MAAKAKDEGREPPTAAVKIDRAIAVRARRIADDKGVDLAKYLTELLRAPVARDWGTMMRRIDKEAGE